MSPWMTTDEAADYLRYTQGRNPRKSVYKFLARKRISTVRRGRFVLIAKADIDYALRQARRPKLRRVG